MKFNSNDFLRVFSSNLFFAEKDNQVYIMDGSRCGNEDYNYGIYDVISKNDILSGKVNFDCIPDIYVEEYIDFMLSDGLKNNYQLPDTVIQELSKHSLDKWYSILETRCKDDVLEKLQYLDRMSGIMMGKGHCLDSMTKKEYESIVNRNEDMESCIEQYIEKCTDERVKKVAEKIKEYANDLLYRHDMSPNRTEENQKRLDKIVTRCIEDIEEHPNLVNLLKSENQIEYFVRQTILYMV